MAEVKIDSSTIKPNSHKYRDTQAEKRKREKLSPVVKNGGVVSTKKPLRQKFTETFMSEDMGDIKNYILMDLIIPGIKNVALDILETAFFGTKSQRRFGNDSRTDYRSKYDSKKQGRERYERDDRRSRRDDRLDYRNIVLLNRSDAESVIDQLHRRIDKYGAVSIAELFDLIDEPSNYNDNNWGWTDERDIGIRRVSRGYLIDVREAIYLD